MPEKGLDASDDKPSLPTGPGDGLVSDAAASSASTPNVVFVLFDDVGYNDFGYSSTDLKAATPTITKLGNEVGAPEHAIRDIVGHDNTKNVTMGLYRARMSPKVMRPYVDRLVYQGWEP